MPARLNSAAADELRIGDASSIRCALDGFTLRLSKADLELVGLPFVGWFLGACHLVIACMEMCRYDTCTNGARQMANALYFTTINGEPV
jgi:hypothetical protein